MVFRLKNQGEEHYVIVAYNKMQLSQKLQDNPPLSTAKKVTFAQWIFADETKPIRLKNNKYLTVVDGIVIEMDSAYLNTDASISISEALRARHHSFYKTLSTHLLLPEQIRPKTLKITLAILLILLANLITQIVLDRQLADETGEDNTNPISASHLPETSIEREAILNALKQKEDQTVSSASTMLHLSTLPLQVSQACCSCSGFGSGNRRNRFDPRVQTR